MIIVRTYILDVGVNFSSRCFTVHIPCKVTHIFIEKYVATNYLISY